jgi:hypothetical protein
MLPMHHRGTEPWRLAIVLTLVTVVIVAPVLAEPAGRFGPGTLERAGATTPHPPPPERYAAGEGECHLRWVLDAEAPPMLEIAWEVASWRLVAAGAEVTTYRGEPGAHDLFVRAGVPGELGGSRGMIRYSERLIVIAHDLAHIPVDPDFRRADDRGLATARALGLRDATVPSADPQDGGPGTATVLANVLLHEVGHHFGLGHEHGGVMDERLTYRLTQTLAFDNQVYNAMGC